MMNKYYFRVELWYQYNIKSFYHALSFQHFDNRFLDELPNCEFTACSNALACVLDLANASSSQKPHH